MNGVFIFYFLYLYIIDIAMIPNKVETIQNEINNLLINEVNKIKLLCDSRGCKIKYNRCLFVNAFIKRLKTGNTWVNLQNEFKISKTHLHRIFTSWSDNNVFKNVYNTF